MKNQKPSDYDFAGWATCIDIKCTDGRTIRDGAFAHCDGIYVPLVYQHDHNDIHNVLGKALLKYVPKKGVRAYGYFNDTQSGQDAREMVRHGDLSHLSVFANHLKQKDGDVLHGEIKEVSLVQAGANPGALIDVVMQHSEADGVYDEAAIIYSSDDQTISLVDDEELEHADDKAESNTADAAESGSGKTAREIFDGMDVEEQSCCVFMMEKAVELALKNAGVAHSDEETAEDTAEEAEETHKTEENPEEKEETEDTEEASETTAEEPENINEEENDDTMKHNAFEAADTKANDQQALCHSFMEELDMVELVKEAKSTNSTLSEKFLKHADEYGIEDLDLLFPDYHNLDDMPQFIKRPDDWVSKILNGVRHVPFAKIRSLFADITADAARAKGYTKGHKKIEEVFGLLKRETNPTTIYKKQKMDRDDIVDLANINVIGWLRQEMRGMLDEEIARAILFSDGRDAIGDDDKIDEEKVRPIIYDDVLFTISKDTTGAAKNIIQTAIRSRKEYRGSGNPVFITTEDYLTEMLLMEDLNQRVIYETVDKLKTALRVSDIITVPVAEGVKNKAETKEFVGLILNLGDYSVGADKGGAINWFEDFDIDFNQQKYLVETRISGALTKPKSAIVLWKPISQNSTPSDEPAEQNNG